AIEAKQAEIRTQPKITIGCLGNGVDAAFEKAFTNTPRFVRVLADVQRRIQRDRAGAPRQQHAGQRSAQPLHQAPPPEDIDRRSADAFAYASDAGMVSSASVPASSLLETVSLPPTSLARSCM